MCSHSHCLHGALLRERFDRRCDGGREHRSGQEQMRFHDGLPSVEDANSFDQKRSTSMTACAKAWGASCGRLCPMPPVMVRCAYLPENFLAYALLSTWGAPLASPSRVMAGTVMIGACANRFSRSSYLGSP